MTDAAPTPSAPPSGSERDWVGPGIFLILLFGFLDSSAQILDLEGVPKEIVLIMQGVIVLCVVIAYELVRRYTVRQVARDVGRKLGETGPPPPTGAPPPTSGPATEVPA